MAGADRNELLQHQVKELRSLLKTEQEKNVQGRLSLRQDLLKSNERVARLEADIDSKKSSLVTVGRERDSEKSRADKLQRQIDVLQRLTTVMKTQAKEQQLQQQLHQERIDKLNKDVHERQKSDRDEFEKRIGDVLKKVDDHGAIDKARAA